MKKHTIIILIIYMASLAINLIPSLKHPDSNLTLMHLVTSISLLISSVLFIKSILKSKRIRLIKTISLIGMFSGLLIFIISETNHIIYEMIVLDIISGVQYPLYLFFVTPLFGINYVINTTYGIFSLLVSLFYLAILCLSQYIKKNENYV